MTLFLTYIQGIRTYTRPTHKIQEHISCLHTGYKAIFLAYIHDTRTYSWPTYWIQEHIPGLRTVYRNPPGQQRGYRNTFLAYVQDTGTLLGSNLDTYWIEGTYFWENTEYRA
jgi:hypothetical protein